MKHPHLVALMVACCACAPSWSAEQLGSLSNGAKVLAVESKPGVWGIRVESSGKASVEIVHPLRLLWYEAEDKISEVAAGYRSIKKTESGLTGEGELAAAKGVVVRFTDRWTFSGQVLRLSRKLAVSGTAPGGFFSRLTVSTVEGLRFPDADMFAPGMIYGGPTNLLERAPGGLANFSAGRFEMREDGFPMPVLGLYFRDGTSLALLDSRPHGQTTLAETNDSATTMIDERFLFGGLGMHERRGGGIDLSFWLPGALGWLRQGGQPTRRLRFHPFREGLAQEYELGFRFGRDESFHEFYSRSWRWAWDTLKPAVNYYDMDVMRRSLLDQLAGTVRTKDGRTAIPFALSAANGGPSRLLRDNDAIMGFVGKNLEGAALMILDANLRPGPAAEKNRALAVAIMDTFTRQVKVAPPDSEGFNIDTGRPSITNPVGTFSGRMHLRAFTDDMRWMLKAYQWEKARGREHPEWLRWSMEFAEWLVLQQRPDGSFPRAWRLGTGEVYEPSPSSSYNVMAFLVTLSQSEKRPVIERFVESAARAGEFCWLNYQARDQFVGGTMDNPNILDKEAGTLSLEGYISLYESTKESEWLERARVAADYAETWIYGWDITMPVDADDAVLHWKKGVSTVGANKINSTSGGVDQWMAGDVEEYAKLYAYTKDEHYLDVARILLHNTKNMVAIPGRLYDLAGPGWQQEHWTITERRGMGSVAKAWLPWVTVNHLEGILALEEYDPALLKRLAQK
jgi:hypothetical protein